MFRTAAYETTVVTELPPEKLSGVVEQAASFIVESNPRFRVTSSTRSEITLETGVSWASWGEILTIAPDANSIRIYSECSWPLQILDWGKNRMNIEFMRNQVERAISETPA